MDCAAGLPPGMWWLWQEGTKLSTAQLQHLGFPDLLGTCLYHSLRMLTRPCAHKPASTAPSCWFPRKPPSQPCPCLSPCPQGGFGISPRRSPVARSRGQSSGSCRFLRPSASHLTLSSSAQPTSVNCRGFCLYESHFVFFLNRSLSAGVKPLGAQPSAQLNETLLAASASYKHHGFKIHSYPNSILKPELVPGLNNSVTPLLPFSLFPLNYGCSFWHLPLPRQLSHLSRGDPPSRSKRYQDPWTCSHLCESHGLYFNNSSFSLRPRLLQSGQHQQ